ncbi:MAG TPA: DUF2516 family protein [Kribbellaceae bacterium]|jgi:hypothetical protein
MLLAQAILVNLPDVTTGWGIFSAVILALKLIALLDASFRPQTAYIAADKLTKPGWLLILGTFTVAHFFQAPLSLIALFGIVAAVVYLVDARPALRRASGGRGKGGGSFRRRRGPRPL